MRLQPRPDAKVETIANTGGRPLGIEFDARGRLIVADARRGLLQVTLDGTVTVLVDEYEGERLRFADDVDIARDGTIWFTEASRRFDVEQTRLEALEGRPTGRLYSFDPETGSTTLWLDSLRFANGVSVAPDGTYVLVSETFGYRIRRLWLSGESRGTDEIFVDHLPGFPDNLRHDDRGLIWVALPSKRSKALDVLLPRPWLRRVVLRLPAFVQPGDPSSFGWVLAFDASGDVVHNLQDPTGRYGHITSVNPFGPWLYLGSLHEHAVGRIARPSIESPAAAPFEGG